jgi:hypothetical protein
MQAHDGTGEPCVDVVRVEDRQQLAGELGVWPTPTFPTPIVSSGCPACAQGGRRRAAAGSSPACRCNLPGVPHGELAERGTARSRTRRLPRPSGRSCGASRGRASGRMVHGRLRGIAHDRRAVRRPDRSVHVSCRNNSPSGREPSRTSPPLSPLVEEAASAPPPCCLPRRRSRRQPRASAPLGSLGMDRIHRSRVGDGIRALRRQIDQYKPASFLGLFCRRSKTNSNFRCGLVSFRWKKRQVEWVIPGKTNGA